MISGVNWGVTMPDGASRTLCLIGVDVKPDVAGLLGLYTCELARVAGKSREERHLE